MTTIRTAVVAVVAAAVVSPAIPAHAATNTEATIRSIANEAAELVAEEQSLVPLADPARGTTATREAAIVDLNAVDARGATLLRQLEQLDVDLTEAIRVALAPLPEPGEDATVAPPDVVYEAAIDDLLRIAATPSAVAATPQPSNSPAIGLLAVGALSLLALGAAALGNTLRRRPGDEELVAMAWSDGLTGLANRRRLDHDVLVHENAPAETAVMMVDVDGFKEINERFGHPCGDRILCEVGGVLSDHVRYDDVVYRFNGEQFCVLLPGASVVDARTIADRIVEAVHQLTLPDDTHVTVSVGVSISDERRLSKAITVADRAMYEAKHLGRDRAVTATARDLAEV